MTQTTNRQALATIEEIVNLEVYPLNDRGSHTYQRCVEAIHQQLDEDGCAHFARFIRADLIDRLREESEELAPQAHYHHNQVTPYATEDDDNYPVDHPLRRFQSFSNGFVAKDLISEDKLVQRLYANVIFQQFIADCLQEERIYEYADPIAGLVINVMPENTTLPWHFDTNEFIVSLMTRRPEAGGEFEYVPEIRTPGNENFDEVQRVLDGDHSRVKVLTLETGDLQLFKGRYSMHRVAPAQGQRLCTLLGYAKEPGMIGRVKRTKDVYGRVTQAHIDAENVQREDSLAG
ncbi:hypothetical protein BFW38_16075 [Terasakiispira papahanaumokuakeensis]|uniref:Fe2OG dioxygenase domain-containing protein n=1 Tax=Terasakiispira papahanaumokuakeensis TaxID=197479 RepID=A0A1E2VCU4_9GAMM|nr:hypothetical protein [Terasakiispira papahanaumokuakeensis]ODC04819.1 hypothetical protein BFW38_16075 [Terasakiispira papahanaumokuakeensis]